MDTGVIVTFSERLNAVLALHWEKFSTQNYFDEHGIFMVTVLCGPLVFAMFLQVVRTRRQFLDDALKNLFEPLVCRAFYHQTAVRPSSPTLNIDDFSWLRPLQRHQVPHSPCNDPAHSVKVC